MGSHPTALKVMALTIYTLGDIPTFTAVLNAVAMVFQSGAFTGPGLGLGAAAGLGLLVSLGVMLLAGGAIAMLQGGGGAGNWAILLVLIIVYSVSTQKVTLNIEDYYTGTATTVANVPFGVAVPGALISSVTRSVADKMEVAFSTVDGNYISLSNDGFASPLQLMLSMRGGKYGLPDADPFLTANIKIFVLDCVAGNAGFDADAYAKQNIPGVGNPIAYITQPGVYRTGLTVIFSKASPAGIGSACTDAAINIQNKMNAFVGPGAAAPIAGYLNANMNKKAGPNTAVPNKYSADDIVALHGKMINGVWGASQTAQDFMITALTSGQISDSYNCSLANSSLATYNQCTMTMTQAMEQWKIDSAGGATGFSKAMQSAMNILLAMFFGFAPLIFIFMMMAGAQGLGILVKYAFFGIWSQSWLPFAVVINYIGQVMVKNEFTRLAAAAPNGLNPATVPAFYDALSIKLAVISDMLAAVPLISMALLSGSVYGLTQVANNMGKDKVDEKGAAPNVQETGAVTRVGPAMNVGSRSEGNARTLASEQTGLASAAINLGNSFSRSTGQDSAMTAANQSSLTNELASSNSANASHSLTSTSLAQIGKTAAASHSKMGQFATQTTNELTNGVKFSNQEKEEIAGTLTVGAMAGLGGGALKKLGVDKAKSLISGRPSAGAQIQAKETAALSKSADIGLIDKNSATISETEIDGRTSSITAAESQSLQGSDGYQRLSSVSDGMKSALQKTVGYTQTQKESIANASSYQAGQTIQLSAVPTLVRGNGRALEILNTVQRGATAEQQNNAMMQNGLSRVDFAGPNAAQDRQTAAAFNLVMEGSDDDLKQHLLYAINHTSPANGVEDVVSAQVGGVAGAIASGRETLAAADKTVKPVAITPSAASTPLAYTSNQTKLTNSIADTTGLVGADAAGNSGTGRYQAPYAASKNVHSGQLESDTTAAGITSKDGKLTGLTDMTANKASNVSASEAVDMVAVAAATSGGIPGIVAGATLEGSFKAGEKFNELTGASEKIADVAMGIFHPKK